MLRVATRSSPGAIFQAVVLPRLAVLRPPQLHPESRAVFCTTARAGAPYADVDRSAPSAGPPYLPWDRPGGTSGTSRAGTRPPRGGVSRNDHRPILPPDPFWDSLSGSSKTALRAAESIIRAHVPRQRPRAAAAAPPTTPLDPLTQVLPNVSTGRSTTRTTAESDTTIPTQTLPFPPPVYALLRQRLFRLAVFKILQTAEYATDPRLVEQTAAYLERGGAGKLASRLRRSCAKTSPPPSPALTVPIKTTVFPASLAENMPKPRVRLWSEPEGKDRPRRPPDHWRHLSTISTSIAFGDLPPSLYPTSPDTSLPSKGAFAQLSKAERQSALTAYYNHHLSRLVSSPSTSPNPFGISTSSSGRPSSPPSPSLRQLHNLTWRIRELERCRGFKPDRVTANILIKCWLRCALAPSPGAPGAGSRVVQHRTGDRWARKQGSALEGWREEDLRAMWSLMRRLMSLGTTSPRLPGQFGRPSPQPEPPSKGGEEELLEYGRHIRPFCGMMVRAARSLGAWEFAEEILEFQAEQRRLLRPDLFHEDQAE